MEILKITDGEIEINLLDTESGFLLNSWRPQIPGFKDGGMFRDSPLSDGRRIVDTRWENVIEVFNLKVRGEDQDKVIRHTQELRRLLVKAVQYWIPNWQNEIVWIEAQAPCETEKRYAWIVSWRTPEDDNPFGQPFLQTDGVAVIDEFELAIEHGPWLKNQPGTGTCIEIAGYAEFCFPSYLIFNGDTSDVQIPDNAVIQDLPTASVTYEAWIAPNSAGEGNLGRIFDKGSRAFFHLEDVAGTIRLAGVIDGAVVNGQSRSTEALTAASWVHVAMTYEDGVNRLVRLWIGGVEVTYAIQNATQGAYVSDVGDDLFIGNNPGGIRGFDGNIGWCRISNFRRWNADFTPPTRCILPPIDANTVGQWIYEGSGTAIDNMEGTAAIDGTASNISWACSCTRGYGNVDPDDFEINPPTAPCVTNTPPSPLNPNEVYIDNKRKDANLTHIYVDGGGAFGVNLLFSLVDYDLYPAVPAVNDAVYFGINTTTPDSGPFNNLVFTLSAFNVDITDIVWEYWNGAWVALTVQDGTTSGELIGDAFERSGSVHWVPPSDWVTTTVNGVVGYWVRARVNGVGGAPTPPEQNADTIQIYTINWPFTEIDGTQVAGDIAALSMIQVTNRSDGNVVAYHTNKLIVGLRSLSRDITAGGLTTPFEAFHNFGDEQLSPFQVNVHGVNTAAVNDIEAPSGRMSQYNPAGVEAMATRIQIQLFTTDAYVTTPGRYRILMRGQQDGGVAGNIELQLVVSILNVAIPFFTSDILATPNILDWQLFDFGDVLLPGAGLMTPDEDFWGLVFDFQASSSSGTPNFNFYDMILIPTDEWSGEFTDYDSEFRAFLGYQPNIGREVLDLDSVELPKRRLRAPLNTGALVQVPTWKINAPGEIILQANADQRYWFLAARGDGSGDLFWEPWIAHGLWSMQNQRYLSSRGNR